MGARLVKEVSQKQMMQQEMEQQQLQYFAQSMIKEGVKNVAAGGDPMAIKKRYR